jgi:hypothetical protein
VSEANAASLKVLRRLTGDDRVRRYGSSIVATAVLVALLGGYAGGWSWTGFKANNQVWDWLNLLLLPVVIGIIPIWLLHAARMSRTLFPTMLLPALPRGVSGNAGALTEKSRPAATTTVMSP